MGDNVTSNRHEPPRVESFIPLNNAGISQYIYSLNHTRNDMQKNKNVAAPADIKGSTPPLVGQTVRGSISVNSTAKAVVRPLPLALLLSDQHPEWERSYRCTCVLSLQYPPAVAVAKMVSFLSLRMVSDIYTPGCLLLCFLILVIFWVSFSFSFFFLPFFLRVNQDLTVNRSWFTGSDSWIVINLSVSLNLAFAHSSHTRPSLPKRFQRVFGK